MTGKIFRKPWMEDKDREKLIGIARKAIQDFKSNPDKFFNLSVSKQTVDEAIVYLEETIKFIHFCQDIRQIAKMIRKT
jgi:hypothetical protein